MARIYTAEFVKSSAKLADCPAPDRPEYAFIGRSNVGKSSLINLLTNKKKLAKISSRPGKTQLINHFEIDERWYLVDLPGYGWAKVSKTEKAKWKKMINEYLTERENLVNIFVLVDSRHDPQDIDLDFMRWLGRRQLPFAIIFTKTDKQGKTQTQSNVAKYKKILRKSWEELPPVLMSSSADGTGKDEIINYIADINSQVDARF
ncbi:MAG: ribosome biogenesis GTP-binding protein YihA/YsxC [Cyclobacteriaceae bacterium]|nr:ribosome biogenesis GTP-binding protein YihA/YsxC [Cyclobacteriaceae bacterium HetDA_MAG_MS6]